MRARFTKLGAALAALAALAIGGSALASAAGGGSSPAKVPALVQQESATADTASKEPAEKTADTDAIQDENGKDDATEAAAGVQNEAAESGSEVPGNDGPGGWADEPANPNADTQQQGQN